MQHWCKNWICISLMNTTHPNLVIPWDPALPNLGSITGDTVSTRTSSPASIPKKALSEAESDEQLAGSNRPSSTLGL